MQASRWSSSLYLDLQNQQNHTTLSVFSLGFLFHGGGMLLPLAQVWRPVSSNLTRSD